MAIIGKEELPFRSFFFTISTRVKNIYSIALILILGGQLFFHKLCALMNFRYFINELQKESRIKSF